MVERFQEKALGSYIDTNASYESLVPCALGQQPPDLCVENGTLFNSFTGEFLDGQHVWIKDGRFTYVGPPRELPGGTAARVLDAEGGVILPGLIDAHTHMVNRVCIEEVVKHIIPSGVTTVITETTELATVAGLDGFRALIDGLQGHPIRVLYTISPLCGLTPQQERMAPANTELEEFLQDANCLGVGEIYWGNALLQGPQGSRVRELATMARSLGKHVDGHTAGARGAKLQAYTLLGARSCHEPIDEKEVLERVRLGYWVMIRQGGIRKELEGVKGVLGMPIDKGRLILCTDSVDPEMFLEEGYLDAALRRALELGVDPALAYQMVTIRPAQCLGLDGVLGSISPGRLADMVIVPSARQFHPQTVMVGGKVVYHGGRALSEPKPWEVPPHLMETVRFEEIPPGPPKLRSGASLRTMELVSRLVTREAIVELSRDQLPKDTCWVLAMDRLGTNQAFWGALKGFGLSRGACGTTMCWDTTDMIVVGGDVPSIRTAALALRAMGGGAAYAVGDQVVASFQAPICGVLSTETMEHASERIRSLESALHQNGVPWEKPLLTLDVLGTAAIPHLRITHQGYVRLRDRAVMALRP